MRERKSATEGIEQYLQANLVIIFVCDKLKLLLDGNLFRAAVDRGCNDWGKGSLCSAMRGPSWYLSRSSQYQGPGNKETEGEDI